MGKFVAQNAIKEMIKAGHNVLGSTVTVLGLTFKENCPDLRNSKVADIINELEEYGIKVQVADPNADPVEAEHEYGVTLTSFKKLRKASVVIIAVAHKEYCELSVKQLKDLMGKNPILIDVKGTVDRKAACKSRMVLWRL
jgi:UDP-N-acetyl-D-galactosamine dehydrogenase